MDLYGYGPIIKGISLAFLCFMVAFKNCKVPILFFILYGIGSLAFVTHLLTIKNQNGSIVDAGIYEQYFNIVLCVLTVLFMLNK
uniref:Uncharacterized protein n=1 Tax=viral metagenome TaxID=1070528 RepID=A0A6C0EWW0_9ZZZZ